MGKQNRNRRTKKREQIVRTAKRLFSRYGARRVTVEELCREANVSKVTFYKYFRNKVELVRKIHDDLTEEAFAKFDEINALDLPFPKKVDLIGQWKLDFVSRINPGFIRELIDVEHTMDEYRERYLGNIRKAQEQGEVRSDIDPEFLWLVIEKFGEMVKDGTWKRVCSDYAQFQGQLRIIIWYGLLTRKDAGDDG